MSWHHYWKDTDICTCPWKKLNVSICRISVLVLLNFEMSQHMTFPTMVTGNAIKRQRDGEGWATVVRVMNQKGMVVLGRWSRQELWTLIDYSAVHVTLNWANENVVHTINLDSLIYHEDHCWMHYGVFVHNCGIYVTGINIPSLFVKTIDINKTFIVMNNKYAWTYYTGVCMWVEFNWDHTIVTLL